MLKAQRYAQVHKLPRKPLNCIVYGLYLFLDNVSLLKPFKVIPKAVNEVNMTDLSKISSSCLKCICSNSYWPLNFVCLQEFKQLKKKNTRITNNGLLSSVLVSAITAQLLKNALRSPH